jgi:hypothetical protein
MKLSEPQRRLLADLSTWLSTIDYGHKVIGRNGVYSVRMPTIDALSRAGFIAPTKPGNFDFAITNLGRRALESTHA